MLGVLCSLVGVPMAVVVAAVLLVRHGWRSAVLQAAPAAIVVVVWALVTGPRSVSPSGPPDLETIVRWVGWSIEGTLEVLGHFPVVGMAMAVVTVGGLALSLRDARVDPAAPGAERVRQRLRPVALPIAGLGGVLLFSLITVRGRWPFGEDAATSDRYLYVMAALAIPALCAAAEAVARRWEGARLPLVLLLLLPIPFNVRGFDDPPFNSAFFERQEAMIAGAVDHPLAEDVPGGIHPPGWDPTMSRALTMDFLFEAGESGRLSVPEVTASPALTEEMAIRFIVYQDSIAGERTDCRTIDGPTELEPARVTCCTWRPPCGSRWPTRRPCRRCASASTRVRAPSCGSRSGGIRSCWRRPSGSMPCRSARSSRSARSRSPAAAHVPPSTLPGRAERRG